MLLYVYETPYGNIADFRPYLDGQDHSGGEHRKLKPTDPRWEKINHLRHPTREEGIGGQLKLVGRAEAPWKELTIFPIPWDGEFVPLGAPAEE